MDELVYWTSRKVDGKGNIKAWARRGICPECNKGTMGKPKDPKTGKPKVRSLVYVCDNCSHEIVKSEYEDTLSCEILYTCPYCNHKDETVVPYKRKKFKGVDSIVFVCGGCNEKIPITKKMKAPKVKKK